MSIANKYRHLYTFTRESWASEMQAAPAKELLVSLKQDILVMHPVDTCTLGETVEGKCFFM